jgi:hypothetical protein
MGLDLSRGTGEQILSGNFPWIPDISLGGREFKYPYFKLVFQMILGSRKSVMQNNVE